jgi:hypothetical protein
MRSTCATGCGADRRGVGPTGCIVCDRHDGPAIGPARWLTRCMVAPLPEPEPGIDPNEQVPDDPAELLPDAPEPLPPPPIEATPDDPGGDPGGVPEPA